MEWLAHHRAVGITDFLVFSNDCEDGTDHLLDRLQELGWLCHVRNPGPWRGGPQWTALKQASRHPLVTGADWLITFDIDEFINIRVGNHGLAALLAALPGKTTAVTLTWRMFGNAGIARYEDTPVTETFTRAAPERLYWPWQAMMFKTLFRNDGTYHRLGIHRPRRPDPERLAQQCWYDGSGRRLAESFHRDLRFSEPGSAPFDLVQLNHYALTSAETFILKSERGGGAHRAPSSTTMDYWVDRNFCDVEDRSILAVQSSASRTALLNDPVVGPLHHKAVQWRHARFASLMTEEPWRALFGRLVSTPPTRVLTEEEARSIWDLRRGAARSAVEVRR